MYIIELSSEGSYDILKCVLVILHCKIRCGTIVMHDRINKNDHAYIYYNTCQYTNIKYNRNLMICPNNKNIAFFETLPTDIIDEILYNCDCNDIPFLCKTSKIFDGYCSEMHFRSLIFKKSVGRKVGRNLDNFSYGICKYICRFGLSNQICIFPGYKNKYAYIIINNELRRIQCDDLCNITINRSTKITINDNELPVTMNKHYMKIFVLTNRGNVYEFYMDDLKLTNITNKVKHINNIINVSSNGLGLLFLDADGYVYGMGHNHTGYLGVGKWSRHHPTLINGLNNIVKVSMALGHSLALNSHGQVYVVGDTIGSMYICGQPTLLENISYIKDVFSGADMSVLIDYNNGVRIIGSVMAECCGECKECEDGSYVEVFVDKYMFKPKFLNDYYKVLVHDDSIVILSKSGILWLIKYNVKLNRFVQVQLANVSSTIHDMFETDNLCLVTSYDELATQIQCTEYDFSYDELATQIQCAEYDLNILV